MFTADTLLQADFARDAGRYVLILIGFGFAPDLFILTVSCWAFQCVKILGSRSDPDAKDIPTTLPLLLIDDRTRDRQRPGAGAAGSVHAAAAPSL